MKRALAKGFTLVELLVVMAIIGALGSISFIVVNNSRKKSRKVECTNNLRQLGTAGIAYSLENYGRLPINGMDDDPNTEDVNESIGYWAPLAKYIYTSNSRTHAGTVFIDGLFRCPTDRRVSSINKSEFIAAKEEQISYNPWTDGSDDPDGELARTPINLNRCKNPSGMPWLTDSVSAGKNTVNKQTFEQYNKPAAKDHSNSIMVLYADNSVKSVENPKFETVAPTLSSKK